MKKFAVLLLACMLAAALAGCGKKDPAASSSGSTTAPATSAPAASSTPAASTGGAAVTELSLTATNYEFDKKEYTVKKGQPVKLTLDNKQGVHGMRIKELNVDLNSSNKSQTVTPDKTGQFEIRCSVPCGSGHTTMTAKLIVE